jgi:putative hemolysin
MEVDRHHPPDKIAPKNRSADVAMPLARLAGGCVMWLLGISILAALIISALCSLMEASLLSLTPAQVADISTRRPRIGAIWQRFKSNIQPPISAILILNTTAHTIGAAAAGAQFNKLYGEDRILAFSIVFTYLMLQFTEILPKTLGVIHNRGIALLIARPLSALTFILGPVIYLVHLINRPLEGRRTAEQAPASLEEITALAGLARLSNVIGSHQERIIRGASRLSRLNVAHVMIPVEHVTFLSTVQSINDAIIAAHLDPHTRFPVCQGDDRNAVMGYVNFKEMVYYVRTNPNERSLVGVIRPVRIVAPEESASELLRVFVDEHVHMAIVRDAGGRTLGLVTLEDIVEELVGELGDEFDRPPRMLHRLSGGMWMVGGGLPMSNLASALEVDLPDRTGTVSDWLLRRIGHVPKLGEVYRTEKIEFTVRRTRRGKVFEVAVSQVANQTPGTSG